MCNGEAEKEWFKDEAATGGNSPGSQSFQHFFVFSCKWLCEAFGVGKQQLILARRSHALWVRHRSLYMRAFGKEAERLVRLSRAKSMIKLCWFLWRCSLNNRENFVTEALSYCCPPLLITFPSVWLGTWRPHDTRKILCLCFRIVGHVLHNPQWKMQYVAPLSQLSWTSSGKNQPASFVSEKRWSTRRERIMKKERWMDLHVQNLISWELFLISFARV